MFAVFRQRPAKMANSPLSEFNVLYNAAMWLPVGGYFGRWARYTPPGLPRHIFAPQVGIFGLRHIDEAASLAGARRLV